MGNRLHRLLASQSRAARLRAIWDRIEEASDSIAVIKILEDVTERQYGYLADAQYEPGHAKLMTARHRHWDEYWRALNKPLDADAFQRCLTLTRGEFQEASEEAMMAGMAGGCAAYNEAIGSPLTGPADCSYCLRPRVAGHHGCMCDDDEPVEVSDAAVCLRGRGRGT